LEIPMITNAEAGTNVEEIAAGIYRINTPIRIPGAGQFNFNQYLILDEDSNGEGGQDGGPVARCGHDRCTRCGREQAQ
jgi:hypothetical protein